MRQGYDYLFKFTILGEPGSGKTALIERYAYDVYSGEHHQMSTDFKARTHDLCRKLVRTQVFEHPGFLASRYRNHNHLYRGVSAYMITVDVTLSEENVTDIIKRYIEHIHRHLHEGTIIFVVGTKLDLLREPLHDTLNRLQGCVEGVLARSNAPRLIRCFVTSARCSINVDAVFEAACLTLLEVQAEKKIRPVIQNVLSEEIAALERWQHPLLGFFRRDTVLRANQAKLEVFKKMWDDISGDVVGAMSTKNVLREGFSKPELVAEQALFQKLITLCGSDANLAQVREHSAMSLGSSGAAAVGVSENPGAAAAAVDGPIEGSSAAAASGSVRNLVGLPTEHFFRYDSSRLASREVAPIAARVLSDFESYVQSFEKDPIPYDVLSEPELANLEAKCEEFKCPISLALPKIPVQLIAGDSEIFDYEEVKKLSNFSNGKVTHPTTRKKINVCEIFPCRFAAGVLRRCCDEVLAQREVSVSMTP